MQPVQYRLYWLFTGKYARFKDHWILLHFVEMLYISMNDGELC